MDFNTKRTWAEIDLAHLAHNVRCLKSLLPAECKFLGVVKANAYGHGAIPVAKKLESMGVDYLAVACLDEGMELRGAGICAPILVLGYTPSEFAQSLIDNRLTQTVASLEDAIALSNALQNGEESLLIHIKVDSGMGRLGFQCDDAHIATSVQEILQACSLPHLKAEGIFTHFANADGDEDYSMVQITRFLDILKCLEEQGQTFSLRHSAASAATLRFPCAHLDMVRGGISLYGHYPDPCCEGLDGPGLLPVMTVKSRIAAIRHLEAGTSISYGCTHVLRRPSQIAVLPMGYADGLRRLLSNQGEVLIHGVRCPILGRVCMDMCMVDVTHLPEVQQGDVAIIFGPELPLEEKADAVNTIQYELLCNIAPRVPRIYLDN